MVFHPKKVRTTRKCIGQIKRGRKTIDSRMLGTYSGWHSTPYFNDLPDNFAD